MNKFLVGSLSALLLACTIDCTLQSKPLPARASVAAPEPCPLQAPAPKNWHVFFSPKGGCTDQVVAAIDAAKTSIRIQAYGFTSEPVAQALVRAKGRGLDVQAVLDSSNLTDKYSRMGDLKTAGIPVLTDSKHQIAHSKVLVLDHGTVETGSFNYTQAAERGNAENCLFIQDPDLAQVYETNWMTHAEHSK